MSTKIVIIQLKEIIYTAIFVGLGILLILMLIFMFSPKKKEVTQTSANLTSGVYTSSLMLNNQMINVEVHVDDNHINSIRFINLDETVETMYPLLKPSLNEISTQVINKNVSLDNINYSNDNKYTSTLLVDAIKKALEKSKK